MIFVIILLNNYGTTHIRIENVGQCLKMICGASLEITSSPGNGTKAVIKIRKGGY